MVRGYGSASHVESKILFIELLGGFYEFLR